MLDAVVAVRKGIVLGRRNGSSGLVVAVDLIVAPIAKGYAVDDGSEPCVVCVVRIARLIGNNVVRFFPLIVQGHSTDGAEAKLTEPRLIPHCIAEVKRPVAHEVSKIEESGSRCERGLRSIGRVIWRSWAFQVMGTDGRRQPKTRLDSRSAA
jgi:hypothetical protein